MKKYYFLGIDGGGTKTITAISDEKGRIVSIAKSGPSNFQSFGIENTYRELKNGIENAIKSAKIKIKDIVFAGFGISGADRDKDFDIILSILHDILPETPKILVNDTTIALRAGTDDGVGLALISGTGTNCIGFNREGKMVRIGGLGPLTGDYGAGSDIALAAYHAAFKYNDGRGKYTILYDMIKKHFRIDDIEDLIELTYYDSMDYHRLNTITPYVFAAAKKNDRIAIQILERCADAISYAALTGLKRLFRKDEKITVALGGSVFIKQPDSIMVKIIKERIKKRYPKTKFVVLDSEPVIGALLLANDNFYGDLRANRYKNRLKQNLSRYNLQD
ncbi:MAG: N-acetylglucosamine kinase [Myxococcota bacterium]